MPCEFPDCSLSDSGCCSLEHFFLAYVLTLLTGRKKGMQEVEEALGALPLDLLSF